MTRDNIAGHFTRRRFIQLAGAAACALSGISWETAALAADTGGGDPATAGPADRDAAVTRLERLFDALEGMVAKTPRDTFDPLGVIATVGRDTEQLFAWVRDNTYWAPYRGCLRGATGVLMDRVGNSLDRSLLLAELLRAAGHKVRLVHAQVPEPAARELLRKVRSIPNQTMISDDADQSLDAAVQAAVKDHGLDAEQLRANIEAQSVQSQRITETLAQRVQQQVPLIAAALGAAPAGASADSQAVDAMREHWWIQLTGGAKAIDLDPLLPDARPGTPAVAGGTPIVSNAGKSLAPPDQYQQVQLRVIVEKLDGGSLTEAVVLDTALRPAELYGQRLGLSHSALDGPSLTDNLTKAGRAQFKDSLLKRHEWMPVLMVGNAKIAQSSFKDDGSVNKNPNPGADKSLPGAVGGFGRGLGGFGGGLGGGGGGNKPAGQLTAEWLEFEIRVPGQPARKIRRPVFDLVGPAARAARSVKELKLDDPAKVDRAMALLGTVDLLLQGSRFSPEFVVHQNARAMLANREALLDIVRRADQFTRADMVKATGKLTPMPGALYDLALCRWQLSRVGGDAFPTSPNVLTLRTGARLKEDGHPVTTRSFDIVTNDVHVRGEADARQTRAEQGVVDTNAEALLLGTSPGLQNAGELIARSQLEGVQWLTVRSAQDPAWKSAMLSADVRARVEQDLAGGYHVMAPAREIASDHGPQAAWWRIDPRTGGVLGMGRDGLGQSSVEYAIVVVWGADAGLLCALVAGLDRDGITVKDAIVCAGTAVTAGGGIFFGLTAVIPAIMMACAAALTTGAWLNKDIKDE